MDNRAAFLVWKAKVDQYIMSLCGLTSDDLPDYCYYDLFEDGVSPKEAAKESLVEAGGY